MSSFDTLDIYSKQITSAFSSLESIIKQSAADESTEENLNDQFSEELKSIQTTVHYI